MKNFIFISPNFPETYSSFVKELKNDGFNVLGIGDGPYYDLNDELKSNITEYYCTDLNDIRAVSQAMDYFIEKYGPIANLESNNEFWLQTDAKLRKEYEIDGLKPDQLESLQRKSEMKKAFIDAGAKVAKYILVKDKDQVVSFIDKVGYPVFTKPDIGVGSQGNFKIENESNIDDFFEKKDKNLTYIMEQFVFGSSIISFDGIANSNSEPLFFDNEIFPPSISDVVKEKKDVFYYCSPKVDPEFEKLGKAIVKSLGIKNRFFHIEFFILEKDIKGLGKKGDYVPLEANIRAPGGYTPDLIDYAHSVSVYKIYADSMAFDKTNEDLNREKFYAGSASRRDGVQYVYSNEDVLNRFKDSIRKWGRNPEVLSDDLGNTYFMARFKTLKELFEFRDYVSLRRELIS